VREKEVREAESGPARAAVELEEEEEEEVEREVRSLRMALDWRRAELKRVFCEGGFDQWVFFEGVCLSVSTMAVCWSCAAQSDSNGMKCM